jgi:hypothetical protein
LFCSIDVNDAPVGAMMTGTYQRLDSDPGSQGDDDVTNPTNDPSSGSPTSLQNNIPSESTESLQPQNGVLSDEHATNPETNTVINPSRFLFSNLVLVTHF